MKQKTNSQKQVQGTREKFRHNLTSAEAYLWNFLKGKKCEGRSFRRQHPIGKYILDFYCPSEKLAIELDGYYHTTYDGQARDEVRTAFLNSKGIRVLRFENRYAFENTDWVLDEIRKSLKIAKPPPSAPLEDRGGVLPPLKRRRAMGPLLHIGIDNLRK